MFSSVLDVLLRCSWFLKEFTSLFLVEEFLFQSYIILIEIIRRCIWNVLRVDNQQATNCDNYAYTRIIPLLLSEEERERVKQKMDELQQAETND